MPVSRFIYQYPIHDNAVFLFNTLTGAADVVGTELAALLQPGAGSVESDFDAELLAALKQRGYWVESGNEAEQLSRWFQALGEVEQPLEFFVCPTFTCNLRCAYCFEDLSIRKSNTLLSAEQVTRMFTAMDGIAREQKARMVNVAFTGGEPLLLANKAIVREIIKRAVDRAWQVTFITNGTQAHHYLDLLGEYKEAVGQMQITLDGPAEIHNQWRVQANGDGTFDVIAANISKLLELGIRVAVRMNVGPENVQSLPSLFQVFAERGWLQSRHFVCQLSPVTDHLNTGEVRNYQPEFRLLEQLYSLYPDWEIRRESYRVVMGRDMERRTKALRQVLYRGEVQPQAFVPGMTSCGAGAGRCLAMGADGLIYPCPETVGQPGHAIGQFDPVFAMDRERWSQWFVNIATAPTCADCNIAPLCGTGCTLQGFSGSSDSFESPCNYAQETIQTFLNLNRERLVRLAGA